MITREELLELLPLLETERIEKTIWLDKRRAITQFHKPRNQRLFLLGAYCQASLSLENIMYLTQIQ